MPISPITFDVSSSLWLAELRKRREAFASKPRIGYTMKVPDDLKWWYWLEFGTAGQQDADAPYKSKWGSGEKYPIDPVNKKVLKWDEDGTTRFSFHVDHPGIRPRAMYRINRDNILRYAEDILQEYLNEDISVAAIKTALRDDILPYAAKVMGEELDKQAPGVMGNNPFSPGGPKAPPSAHEHISAPALLSTKEVGHVGIQSTETRIMLAAPKLASESPARQIYISRLHESMSDIPLTDLHQSLINLDKAGKISLQSDEHGESRLPKGVRDTAVSHGGEKRHLFYISGPGGTIG